MKCYLCGEICQNLMGKMRLPQWLSGKESACNAGVTSSIPELGRLPGGGHGKPL